MVTKPNLSTKKHNRHWTSHVKWFTQGDICFGIVRINDPYDGIKYYIGVGLGVNERADYERIKQWGAKYPKKAGDALFDDGYTSYYLPNTD